MFALFQPVARLLDALSGNLHRVAYRTHDRAEQTSKAFEVHARRADGMLKLLHDEVAFANQKLRELETKLGIEGGYARGLAEEIRRTDSDLIHLAREFDKLEQAISTHTEEILLGAARRDALEARVAEVEAVEAMMPEALSEITAGFASVRGVLEEHRDSIRNLQTNAARHEVSMDALARAVFPLWESGPDGSVRRVQDPHTMSLWDAFKAIWDCHEHANRCQKCSGFSNCSTWIALWEDAMTKRLRIFPKPWDTLPKSTAEPQEIFA